MRLTQDFISYFIKTLSKSRVGLILIMLVSVVAVVIGYNGCQKYSYTGETSLGSTGDSPEGSSRPPDKSPPGSNTGDKSPSLPGGKQDSGPASGLKLKIANYRVCTNHKVSDNSLYAPPSVLGERRESYGLTAKGSKGTRKLRMQLSSVDASNARAKVIMDQSVSESDSTTSSALTLENSSSALTKSSMAQRQINVILQDPQKSLLLEKSSGDDRLLFKLYDDRDSSGDFTKGDGIISDTQRVPQYGGQGLLGLGAKTGYVKSYVKSEQYDLFVITYLISGRTKLCPNSGNNGDTPDEEPSPDGSGGGGGGGEVPCGECDQTSSPLAIDLDNNDFQLTSVEDGVMFDIEGQGRQMPVGWFAAGSQDALLFLDRNGNGVVDGGHELFGTATEVAPGYVASNGFEALLIFDTAKGSDADTGVINKNDKIYSQLQLWIDNNPRDGRSQKSELVPLSQYVESIDLRYKVVVEEDQYGNQIFARSKVKMQGGALRNIADVWFTLK